MCYFYLAQIYEEGEEGAKKNIIKAIEYYQLSYEKGYVPALEKLKEIIEKIKKIKSLN